MNYLITGVSRTGKSTLAKQLYTGLNKYTHDYSLIPFDPFIDSWKEKESMNNCKSLKKWEELEFSNTCRDMIAYAIKKLSKAQYSKQNFIFESAHAGYDPKYFEMLIEQYKIINLKIIYLLHDTTLTNVNLLKKVRDNDCEADWTFNKNEKELLYKFECALKYNKSTSEYLDSINQKYFITTQNRNDIFKNIVVSIENESDCLVQF